MGLLGLGASFFPHEILNYFDTSPEGITVVLAKVVGGLYLGLAVLNWMAREKLIGGIYSRPVAVGNFAHFFAITMVLGKQLVAMPNTAELAIGAVANAVFAASFGYVVFAGGGSCG